MEHLFKVLVVGEVAAGKTSLIKQYVHNMFTEIHKATIGVDFALKVVKLNETATVRLQLWDIGGQARFGSMTHIYYRDAHGCFIVTDLSDANGFHSARKWIRDVREKMDPTHPIPMLLLCNKYDLEENSGEAEALCREEGLNGFALVSAKMDIGIDGAALSLIKSMLNNDEEDEVEYQDTIQLAKNEPKKKCCN